MELLYLLEHDPVVLAAFGGFIGLAIGSFLNVLIHRLPRMMERQWRAEYAELTGTEIPATERYNLFVPRSGCPACGHRITALENIPIASWLWLRGKCSGCGTGISVRYPLVEALTGISTAYTVWHFGFTWAAAAALLFVWTATALAFIDLDTFYLPDDLTLPLLWAGLLLNIGGMFTSLQSAVIGAAAGYLSLWSVYWLFKLITGKEGMGYGDFKLLAAIGAWLGWQMLPLVILLSSVVGAAVGIALILFARHGRQTPIPFGPYLAVAGLIALFHGDALTHRYLDLF